jgi:hypothetical protein
MMRMTFTKLISIILEIEYGKHDYIQPPLSATYDFETQSITRSYCQSKETGSITHEPQCRMQGVYVAKSEEETAEDNHEKYPDFSGSF